MARKDFSILRKKVLRAGGGEPPAALAGRISAAKRRAGFFALSVRRTGRARRPFPNQKPFLNKWSLNQGEKSFRLEFFAGFGGNFSRAFGASPRRGVLGPTLSLKREIAAQAKILFFAAGWSAMLLAAGFLPGKSAASSAAAEEYNFTNVATKEDCEGLVQGTEKTPATTATGTSTVALTRNSKERGFFKKCMEIVLEKREKKRAEEEAKKKTGACKEAEKNIKEARDKFAQECRDFAGGMNCEEAVGACALCPERDKSALASCVNIGKKVRCPQLSGDELETAKENRDKAEEEIKDLEGELKDLNDDLVEKKGELADLKTAHQEGLGEIKTKHDQAEAELKQGLKKGKIKIESATEKQLAAANKGLSKALKIQHEFENAISDANKKRRDEETKVFLNCKNQARKRLADYRSRRRKAIKAGTLKKTTLNLIQRNRVSFAQSDQARYEIYHRQCMADSKPRLEQIQTNHAETLKRISQKSKEYKADLNRLKSSVAALNQKAYSQKNELLKEYAEEMETLMTRVNEKYGQQMAQTQTERQKLSQVMASLNQQIIHKKAQVDEQKRSFEDNVAAHHYLRSKGVQSDSGADSGSFSGALQAMLNVDHTLTSAMDSCRCVEKSSGTIQAKETDSEDELPPTDKETSVCRLIDTERNEGRYEKERIEKLRSRGRR